MTRWKFLNEALATGWEDSWAGCELQEGRWGPGEEASWGSQQKMTCVGVWVWLGESREAGRIHDTFWSWQGTPMA